MQLRMQKVCFKCSILRSRGRNWVQKVIRSGSSSFLDKDHICVNKSISFSCKILFLLPVSIWNFKFLFVKFKNQNPVQEFNK